MAKMYDGYEVVVALLNVVDACAIALQEVAKANGVDGTMYTRVYESAMEAVKIMEQQVKEKHDGV